MIFFLLEVLEHEQELALDDRHFIGERLLREREDRFDVAALGGQIDRVEVLGHGEDLVDIFSIRLTNPKHGGRRHGTTVRLRVATAVAAAIRPYAP